MSTLLNKILLFSGGAAAAAFDPSSVAGYSRDWDFSYITNLTTDTGGTTPVTADADPIGTILCRAGSGVRLVAPSDATRGTYKVNIQNGNSVGRADGSDDNWTNATAITADASQTIFAVVRKRTAGNATPKYVWYLGAGATLITRSTSGAGWIFTDNQASGAVDLGGTPTDWSIVAVKFTSTASAAGYVNGGAAVTFDPANAYSGYTAVTLCGANSDYDIGRVLVYSDALSDANLNYLFSGLGALWGISVTPVS